jgi:hypothetical protein
MMADRNFNARRLDDATHALAGKTLEVGALELVEINGEPRVVDTVLGKALGYERPRKIRELIERYREQLEQLGPLPQRGAMVDIGSGAIRAVTEYLLNREQINYLITCCGLPDARNYCVLIAKVFTAWQDGRLVSADAQTTIELQDASEQAADAAPGLSGLYEQLSLCAKKTDLFPLIQAIDKLTGRKDPSDNTKRLLVDVVARFFDGRCPCCSEAKILDSQGRKLSNAAFDHATDCPSKNAPDQMWLICAPCNAALQLRRLRRRDVREEWEYFQKRRAQLVRQFELPLPE